MAIDAAGVMMTIMTPKSPRQILEEALFPISIYKNPDLTEVRKVVDPILKAAGLGTLEHHRVDAISFGDGIIRFETTYAIRGCTQQEEFVFPESLLSEADPVAAATRWGLAKQLDEAEERANEVRRELASLEADVQEKKAALDAYDRGLSPHGTPSR